jgi:hypothetical protein
MKRIILSALVIVVFASCNHVTTPVTTYNGFWHHYGVGVNIYMEIYKGDSLKVIREDTEGGTTAAVTYFRGDFNQQVQYISGLWDWPIRLTLVEMVR